MYLDDTQIEKLDAVALRHGVSRTELVRRLLDNGIDEAPISREADLAAIRESFGVLSSEEEFSRGNLRAFDWLQRARQETGMLAISVVSVTEIAGGMRAGESVK